MKNIKFALLTCGVLGVIACFIPIDGISFWDRHQYPTEVGGGGHVYLVLAGYALAGIMGVVGVATGLKRPQAITALAGFGLVLLKLRNDILEVLEHGAISSRLMILSAIVGLVASLLATAMPEQR